MKQKCVYLRIFATYTNMLKICLNKTLTDEVSFVASSTDLCSLSGLGISFEQFESKKPLSACRLRRTRLFARKSRPAILEKSHNY